MVTRSEAAYLALHQEAASTSTGLASDALAHRAVLVLSTGQGAVLSQHDYGLITGLREEPDENMLTGGSTAARWISRSSIPSPSLRKSA